MGHPVVMWNWRFVRRKVCAVWTYGLESRVERPTDIMLLQIASQLAWFGLCAFLTKAYSVKLRGVNLLSNYFRG